MGLKNLAKFNDALLAKQAWRIINNPDTLFSRIMEARYFKDDSILDAKERKNQSYRWSSLLVGLELLKKGLCYNVGNGESIRLERDNFIDSVPPRTIRMSQTLPNITLDKFIKNMGNYRFWDEDMIQAYIAPEDQMALRGIHLPITVAPDRLLWNYNTTGDYTVRSGYWLYTHDPSYTGPLLPAPHGSLDLKKQIWKLSI